MSSLIIIVAFGGVKTRTDQKMTALRMFAKLGLFQPYQTSSLKFFLSQTHEKADYCSKKGRFTEEERGKDIMSSPFTLEKSIPRAVKMLQNMVRPQKNTGRRKQPFSLCRRRRRRKLTITCRWIQIRLLQIKQFHLRCCVIAKGLPLFESTRLVCSF